MGPLLSYRIPSRATARCIRKTLGRVRIAELCDNFYLYPMPDLQVDCWIGCKLNAAQLKH
jgi:hypothetical protein